MDNFDTNRDFAWERAQADMHRAQTRYEGLNEKDKRLMDQIRAIHPGNYDADWKQVRLIADIHDNNAVNAFCDIFHFGFMKGQRAEKARMKKKAQTNKKKERILN